VVGFDIVLCRTIHLFNFPPGILFKDQSVRRENEGERERLYNAKEGRWVYGDRQTQ
jgi:hypothetical protein